MSQNNINDLFTINDLFITNEVRDYIKQINDNFKNGFDTNTEYISLSLYFGLFLFMRKIFHIDVLTSIFVFKNYLKYYVKNYLKMKNDNKNKMKEIMAIFIYYINIFIYNSSNIEFKDNEEFKLITDNIIKQIETGNEENTDNAINKLFDFFNKNYKIFHNEKYITSIKECIANNPEDEKLFLEFFDIVLYDEKNYEKYTIIYNYNNKNAKFMLKKNGNIINLLEYFNGKNVKVIIKTNEFNKIDTYKKKIEENKNEIIKKYAKEAIDELNKEYKTGGNLIEQQGGGIFDSLLDNFIDFGSKYVDKIKDSADKAMNIFDINFLSPSSFLVGWSVYENNYGKDIMDSFRYSLSNWNTFISGMWNNFVSSISNTVLIPHKNMILDSVKNMSNKIQKDMNNDGKNLEIIVSSMGYNTNIKKSNKKLEKKAVNLIKPFIGGSKESCFIIPNLKQELLKILINFNNISLNGIHIPTTFSQCNIPSSYNNSYYINTKPVDKYKNLTETRLYRNKNKKNIINTWEKINKELKTINIESIQTGPNYIQILKDAKITNLWDIQNGGTKEDELYNTQFINSINEKINFGYSLGIVNILKKALRRLNINNIYLSKDEIKKIENSLTLMVELEKKLLFITEKIINISKIKNNNSTTILNEKSLDDYIKEHQLIMEKTNKNAHLLNDCLMKMIKMEQ